MQQINFDEALEKVLETDPRYHRDAYYFLREALEFTQNAQKLANKENRGLLRHVTGQELLDGVRQYALSQYGPMAMTVLNEWGVRNCQDFGELVFNMVEARLLAKTEKDSRADYQTGYDFVDAFQKPFWPGSRLKSEPAPKVNSEN